MFSSNQNIGEGESNFDDKYVEKSVQLVRGSSFRNDLLQNPYFSLSFSKNIVLFWLQMAYKDSKSKFGFDFRKDEATLY